MSVTKNNEFINACGAGNIRLAKQLHSEGVNPHIYEYEAFKQSCYGGHYDVAVWLYNEGADIHSDDDVVFEKSCSVGQLHIAKWLHELGAVHNSALKSSCETGQLETIKWLYGLGIPVDQNSMKVACKNGHYEVAKWVYELTEIYDPCFFLLSCGRGSLEFVMWLHELGVSDETLDDAMRNSISHNRDEITKWLYSISPKLIEKYIRLIYDESLYDYLGIDPEIATLFKCIKNKAPFPEVDEIDNSIINSLAHYNMITHLDALKEKFSFITYDVINDKIENLRIDRTNTKNARNINNEFINACKQGNIITAKKLVSLGVSPKNNIAFVESCENGHLYITRWLYELCPDLLIDNLFELGPAFLGEYMSVRDINIINGIRIHSKLLDFDNIDNRIVAALDKRKDLYLLEQILGKKIE